MRQLFIFIRNLFSKVLIQQTCYLSNHVFSSEVNVNLKKHTHKLINGIEALFSALPKEDHKLKS